MALLQPRVGLHLPRACSQCCGLQSCCHLLVLVSHHSPAHMQETVFSPIFWSYRPSKHLALHPAGRVQGRSTELVKAWSSCSLAWFLLIPSYCLVTSAYSTCWKKHKFSLRLLFLNAESKNRPNSEIPGLEICNQISMRCCKNTTASNRLIYLLSAMSMALFLDSFS